MTRRHLQVTAHVTGIALLLASSAGEAQVAPGPDAQRGTTAVAPRQAGPARVEGSSAAVAAQDAGGHSYRPEGRRDPFVSLLRRGSDTRAASTRSGGLAGLAVAEIALKGTVQGRAGYVGLVLGADSKTYIVRAGDKLLDGTIQTITPNAIVISQRVNDPLSRERQREVRKALRQADEVR